jgi:hypothetical protein
VNGVYYMRLWISWCSQDAEYDRMAGLNIHLLYTYKKNRMRPLSSSGSSEGNWHT